MNSNQPNEQALNEFIRMKKKLEKNIKTQAEFIARFRQYTLQEDLFSQLIEELPYPVAFFRRSGLVYLANRILREEAAISLESLSEEKINLTNRITTENFPLLEALDDVFAGKAPVLLPLSYPLELFCSDFRYQRQNAYQRAFLFPLTDGGPPIAAGVMLLMK